ncbi:UrcA family protein [Parasphingopyxis marina]|uniref:UrcA family protein n=1 Tax=Parasphingopyxis marina TaxID=2761622 RepID=A0A842HTU6_9SPHN|nr:UrcA family protein [Parasphingopyxis marina]MBC2776506.1 UrcA family protein [Parasphingopyxis marina]
MKKFAFAVAAIGMAGATTAFTAAPAFAGTETGETQSVAINTGIYNVGSAAGYRELSQRIDRAARQVCGTVSPQRLAEAPAIRACQEDARASAMRQLSQIAEAPAADGVIATR